ncbi:cupin domain-containing protein [Membranihabitans marinus]|uniref:cupin domain-containing protein n=1 Tax=Membranihabitans marinus TaxID=1227546 RepID=UPI001F241FDE|nr:cupin domain-containing protein [Membranihabitans marinus]
MDKLWKFVKNDDVFHEIVEGRIHHWHYHPQIMELGQTYMVKVTIPVGKGHDFHKHPGMNEILYFLEGKAEQWIEDEKQILRPGDSIYLDPDVVHATFNVGDTDLVFLAVLSPSQGWEAGTIDVSRDPPYNSYRNNVSTI